MRFTGFIAVCFSTIALVLFLGCASMGGGQISGINWALAKNGGTVSVFSDQPEHPAANLIDGVTSSAGWNEGAGWEAPLIVAGTRRRGTTRSEQERHWVIIDLAQPITVNNVKVHTIDSEEYPAMNFGVSSLLVQCEIESILKEKLWIDAETFKRGLGEDGSTIKDNVSGVINVRFKPVSTQRIRILLYRTNDLARSEADSKSLAGTIRLTEIEVYGMGKQKNKDELENLFGQ